MNDEFGDIEQDDVAVTAEWLAGLPAPLFWHLLVMPIKPKAKSKGGIVIPLAGQEAQRYLNYMGKVVAVGPLAGRDKRLTGRADASVAPNFPGVGDYVVYGKYAGQRMTYRGVTLAVLNDDEILCKVGDPESLTVHI